MRKILVIISCCIFLAACDEKEKQTHQHIHDTVYTNWNNYVPLDELVIAAQECKKYPDITDCNKLDNQLYDIAVSFSTCKQLPQSTLCNAVIKKISNHPIKNILPEAEAESMSDHPFYFNLPTGFLEAYSRRAGYRAEMWNLWIYKYQTLLDKTISWAIILLAPWALFIFCKNEIAEFKRRKHEQEKLTPEYQENLRRLAEKEKQNEQFQMFIKRFESQKAQEQKERDKKHQEKLLTAAQRQAEQAKLVEENRRHESEQAERELRKAEEKQKADEIAARKAAEKKLIEEMMAAAVKNLPRKK